MATAARNRKCSADEELVNYYANSDPSVEKLFESGKFGLQIDQSGAPGGMVKMGQITAASSPPLIDPPKVGVFSGLASGGVRNVAVSSPNLE